MKKGPACIIDLPTPYEPPHVWMAFLELLNGYDHNDSAVAHAFETAVRHLHAVSAAPEPPERLRNARREFRVVTSTLSPDESSE